MMSSDRTKLGVGTHDTRRERQRRRRPIERVESAVSGNLLASTVCHGPGAPRSAQSRCARWPSPVVAWATGGLAGLLLLGGLVACGPSEPATIRRLIPEKAELFAADHIRRRIEVLDWRFARSDDLASWTHDGFDLGWEPRGGVVVVGSSGPPDHPSDHFRRPVALDAAEVDEIEVELAGLLKLTLEWRGADEDFDPQRTLVARADSRAASTPFVFSLEGHPEWRGQVAELRFRPQFRGELHGRLIAVRGYRKTFDERLDPALERPWKVELGHETRSARLATTGHPLVFEELAVPPRAVLDFAYGVLAADGAATRFALQVDGEKESERLFETELGSGEGADRWHTGRVDLSRWAGESVTLRLDTTVEGVEGVAVWGDLALTTPGAADRPDVVLVVLDTLRADRLSLYGYGRRTSPRLDAWARRRGVVFRSVVASSPWTLPSHLSLFTGLDTLSHGVSEARSVPDHFELLAETLQNEGYETVAITGGSYLDPSYGFAQGFDRYYTSPNGRRGKDDWPAAIRRARGALDGARRPVFLFLHTYAVHWPYRAHQPFYGDFTDQAEPPDLDRIALRALPEGTVAGAVRRKGFSRVDTEGEWTPLTREAVTRVSAAYDSGVAFADHHLGDFLEALAERDRETLVVVTSDHGEALGEHDLAGHAYLHDFNLLVPLVIAWPGGLGAGRRVEQQVRLIDVPVTVLDTLGMAPPVAIDGRSLVPLLTPGGAADFPPLAWSSVAYQGIALRGDNRWKYVVNPTLWQRRTAGRAFYRLDLDPGESDDLAPTQPTDDLARVVAERFAASFRGLRVECFNPTDEEGQLTLAVPALAASQVWSFDAPPGVSRVPRPGRLEITLPPGHRFSVALALVTPRTPIDITLRHGQRAGCTTAVGGGETGAEPVALGETCQRTAVGAGQGLELVFSYGRDTADQAPAIPTLSAELEAQLEALGYVD